MKRQRFWPAGALVVALAVFGIGTATVGRSAIPVPGYSGYATGATLHVTGLDAGLTGPRLADVELAFSGAASDSDGFGPSAIQNEMQVEIQNAAAGLGSTGRGSGAEVGLGSNLPSQDRDLVLSGEANAVAAPNSGLVTEEIAAPAGPLLYASLLRGQAVANFDDNPCDNGFVNPLGFGLGYSDDAQLVDTGAGNPDGSLSNPVLATDDPAPDRGMSQSISRVYAIPNGNPGRFGLVSEVRETFAPIFLSRGTGLPTDPGIVIELLGEWIFRTTATGLAGGSTIDYTVVDSLGAQPSNSTPIIRISMDGGLTYTNILFQDVFGGGGIAPLPPNPLLNLAIGEAPRAISAPGAPPVFGSAPTAAADGTATAAAVDVVRLSLLQDPLLPLSTGADIRVGHFEASVAVPQGGFECVDPTTTTSEGYLEICTKADNQNGTVTGNFEFSVAGQTLIVPINGCSAPTNVGPGRHVVTQTRRNGIRIGKCYTLPETRLVRCDPGASQAVVRVFGGGVRNETRLYLEERIVDPGRVGSVKVCNIAGSGVAEGTSYRFNVGGKTLTVPAGPASQGGFCKIAYDFPQGSQVDVTETIPGGGSVSDITVNPASRRVSSNTAGGTARVRIANGVTVVSFTNEA